MVAPKPSGFVSTLPTLQLLELVILFEQSFASDSGRKKRKSMQMKVAGSQFAVT